MKERTGISEEGYSKHTMNNIGNWLKDTSGLPCFEYTGRLPYTEKLPSGQDVKLPEDPWFLLGNYQMTLFTHVSGDYELITGQRSWGRLNQGSNKNSGNNAARISIGDQEAIDLIGPGVNSKKLFGCGFAEYTYSLNGIKVTRNLSVKPSSNYKNGESAVLITVTICNSTDGPLNIGYCESVKSAYCGIESQRTPEEDREVTYKTHLALSEDGTYAYSTTEPFSPDPMFFSEADEIAEHDGVIPHLFMKNTSDSGEVRIQGTEMSANYKTILAAKDSLIYTFIVGFHFDDYSVDGLLDGLRVKSKDGCQSAFSGDWLEVLPSFPGEGDPKLAQELVWHAYTLEAMATYSHYYEETKIPQGTIYDYDWGLHASARDNLQHTLPLCYYNQELAKSSLRYLFKRTDTLGEVRLIEQGNGYASAHQYSTSDQQLYFFFILSEYLRITKDYDFLNEMVAPFPYRNMNAISVTESIKNLYRFLKNQVGTGEHGLLRLLNSDWNDAVYYIVKEPYNLVLRSGESHMNTAMAISIFPVLIHELRNAGVDSRLCDSMEMFRSKLEAAFYDDLGDRTFPRRMYFAGKAFGEDNMFLEPMGFTLLDPNASLDFKKKLYSEMQNRVYAGEKIGARQQENPVFDDEGYDYGSRENGGVWYSLNGPVIMGVSKFDKNEAVRLLKMLSFDNYSRKFPQFWSSYWSASDNIESSLIEAEGLPDQTESYADIPVYCAHPHAWLLYCYYYINESV